MSNASTSDAGAAGSGDARSGKSRSAPPAAATVQALRQRAELLGEVRRFFADRGVLEVETPLLCQSGVIDAHLDPVPVESLEGETRYLLTSPEPSMKRLLAAGSGPIYQITRAFRQGERGRLHNPEFTILEWYRPGFSLADLMTEVEQLACAVFSAAGRSLSRPFERRTYAEAFERYAAIDPLTATDEELAREASELGAGSAAEDEVVDRDALLDVILVRGVEPHLGVERPTFIHRYPVSQAALARVASDDPRVAERFELYVSGVELANGYDELVDASEQRARFESANEARKSAGTDALPMDERLLAALEQGMPTGAGVAVGFDRLVMLALGFTSVDEVLSFPWELA